MQRKKTRNGITVLYSKRNSGTLTLEINVSVGSNDEGEKEKGISHFIEHMLFEGTIKRKDSLVISNEIEKLGGELNAATSNTRTFYYAKVRNKDFPIALDILSDILLNPRLEEKDIEHERRIILEEIKQVIDQPRYYQWVLFQKALFANHPAKHPVYGYVETVKSITRKDLLDYYRKHYIPSRITVVVVGNPENDVFEMVDKAFSEKEFFDEQSEEEKPVPEKNARNELSESRDMLQSYMVMGYKTVPKSHPDSDVLEVIRGHLGRGQSGRLFHVVRTQLGIAYEVGVYNNPGIDYGFMAFYVCTNKDNIQKSVDAILKELRGLRDMTGKELAEAKTFLEGEFELNSENTQNYADMLAFWEQCGCKGDIHDFLGSINKVTLDDVKRVAEAYFTDDYSLSVLKQND
jgi:predicted Zn-dependent peptidase